MFESGRTFTTSAGTLVVTDLMAMGVSQDDYAAYQVNRNSGSLRREARAAQRLQPARRGGLEAGGYFVDVPSTALKRRRACVPAIVSLTAIRSQAPLSTSSNVRDGYGSTL